MQLTKKTDYCFRVLIYLQDTNKKVKIKDLAQKLEVSKNHLSVVVNKLSELGYITSTSGPQGGITFNDNCKDNLISDLLLEFENFDLVECFDVDKNKCNLTPRCKLKRILSNANHAFIKETKKYKIKDLI